MPWTIHEYFSSRIVDVLKDQLRDIRERGGKAGRFASKITSVGSVRIFLKESDEDAKTLRRQTDAQFQHPDATYPGVVVEISYSQDGKMCGNRQDYILFSSGNIKAVIGIDINPLGKESTVSLWRPKFTWLEGEEITENFAHGTIIFFPRGRVKLMAAISASLTDRPRIKMNA